jgi:hypothetical protein
MNEPIRSAAIRTKLQEMTESIGMIREHLPDSADAFTRLGIVRDGISTLRSRMSSISVRC